MRVFFALVVASALVMGGWQKTAMADLRHLFQCTVDL